LLNETLTDTSIKALNMAKTAKIDDFKRNSILDYIRKSLLGFSIKLIIRFHGTVKIPDIENKKIYNQRIILVS